MWFAQHSYLKLANASNINHGLSNVHGIKHLYFKTEPILPSVSLGSVGSFLIRQAALSTLSRRTCGVVQIRKCGVVPNKAGCIVDFVPENAWGRDFAPRSARASKFRVSTSDPLWWRISSLNCFAQPIEHAAFCSWPGVHERSWWRSLVHQSIRS